MRHGDLVLQDGLGYKSGSGRCFKRRRGALVRLCCSMVCNTYTSWQCTSIILSTSRAFYQDKDIALLCYPDKHQRQTFVGTFVAPSALSFVYVQ